MIQYDLSVNTTQNWINFVEMYFIQQEIRQLNFCLIGQNFIVQLNPYLVNRIRLLN